MLHEYICWIRFGSWKRGRSFENNSKPMFPIPLHTLIKIIYLGVLIKTPQFSLIIVLATSYQWRIYHTVWISHSVWLQVKENHC